MFKYSTNTNGKYMSWYKTYILNYTFRIAFIRINLLIFLYKISYEASNFIIEMIYLENKEKSSESLLSPISQSVAKIQRLRIYP